LKMSLFSNKLRLVVVADVDDYNDLTWLNAFLTGSIR